MKNKKYLNIWMALILLFSCDDPYQDKHFQAYEEYPSSTYLDARQEDFSKWIEILHRADLYNALNQASETFTLFVPDNDAVDAFYKKNGISSAEELGQDFARELVKYHVINAEISQKTFLMGGKLTTPTISEDYLTVSFDESEGSEGGLNAIYLNSEARVTELANVTTNGLVYVLNAVLTPLTQTLYDRLEENAGYSIFREAVDKTGWKKRLDSPYDTVYSDLGRVSYLKKNFTLFAVTNEIFAQEGISDLNALISRLGASTDYTSDQNALRNYIGYHLTSLSNYREDLFPFDDLRDSTIIWTTQAVDGVFSTNSVGGSHYINYSKSSSSGISLVEGKTDIQAKNGIIHEVDHYMPVWSPDPMTVIWDLCEYADVAAVVNTYGAANDLGDCYQKYQTAEHQISLQGDEITSYTWKQYSTASASSWKPLGYMLTKANTGTTVNTYKAYKNDMLIVNLGYMGSVSMQTPVLLKGKYQVMLYYACAGSLSDFINGGSKCQFTMDDQTSEVYVYNGAKASVGIYSMAVFNEIEFDNTAARTMKLVLMDSRATSHTSYRLQLDYIKFIPVTD